MYTHHILLVLHLIAATIWVGGHLVLAIGYLPKALKHRDFSYIGNFEAPDLSEVNPKTRKFKFYGITLQDQIKVTNGV